MKARALFLLLATTVAAADPAYLGNSRDGFAISVAAAVEAAKPHLYESYKQRVANPPKTESEFWAQDYPIHVILEDDYYYVVASLRKKLFSQYMENAVRVNKFSGAVEAAE